MSAPDAPQLRDIHLPVEPGWWPPAPGWWIVAGVLIALAAWGLVDLVRRSKRRRWRRRVRAEFERIVQSHARAPDPVRLGTELSSFLRRVSALLDPAAAALRGEAWLAFLDAQWPQGGARGAAFGDGTGRALLDAPYRRHDDPAVASLDAPALIGVAGRWLDHVLRRRVDHA